uniref:Uncharacterized protein n=1 Tax=Hyaloperonospora arabidopsidis (strain Emoy2) TaxID=559515 RepID=M4BMS2_HYAAE
MLMFRWFTDNLGVPVTPKRYAPLSLVAWAIGGYMLPARYSSSVPSVPVSRNSSIFAADDLPTPLSFRASFPHVSTDSQSRMALATFDHVPPLNRSPRLNSKPESSANASASF